ncbi:hypothetical protein WAI453_004609 [Rhynchosporium graminicola]
MAFPQGSAVLAAGIAGVLPEGSWLGAPNNGPRYILCRQNLVNIRSHAVCINTGGAMMNNRQASVRNRSEWSRRSDRGVPGPGNPVRVRLAGLLLGVGAIVDAAGDAAQKTPLPTHNIKILINVANFDPLARGNAAGTEEHLRTCIQAVLNHYMLLPPVVPPGGNPALAYQRRGAEIAFDLVGSGIVGYGAERAAENVLAAIQGWFNDPVTGAARRAAITTVFLSVPVTQAQDPQTIESAWWRAWYRYVRPDTGYVVGQRHLPWVDVMDDEENALHAANPGQITSLPGRDGRLLQGPGVVAGAIGLTLV